MSRDNWFGILCLALAALVTKIPEAKAPAPGWDNNYAVAEGLGCSEVLRACNAKKRMAWVKTEGKHGS